MMIIDGADSLELMKPFPDDLLLVAPCFPSHRISLRGGDVIWTANHYSRSRQRSIDRGMTGRNSGLAGELSGIGRNEMKNLATRRIPIRGIM